MAAELPPLTPEGLAASPEFYDGSWRDDQGRTLRQAIYNAFIEQGWPNPSLETEKLWNDAADLFEQRHPQVIGERGEATWSS